MTENWNSANGFFFYGKEGELTGPDREHQEVSMLALHLLQPALVDLNTYIHLWFAKEADKAASFYCSVSPDAGGRASDDC